MSTELAVLDLEYEVKDTPAGARPVLYLYGVTQQGQNVLVHIHGFLPYFYVALAASVEPTEPFLLAFERSLENELKKQPPRRPCGQNKHHLDEEFAEDEDLEEDFVPEIESAKRQRSRLVMGVTVHLLTSIWGYQTNASRFLRVEVAQPNCVSVCRQILEKQGLDRLGLFATFESNVAFVMRFMVDMDIRGGGWVEVRQEDCSDVRHHARVSRCHYELELRDYRKLVVRNDKPEIPRLKQLSFDIECKGRKGEFPTPERDPVIQIGNVVKSFGDPQPSHQVVFTLGSCDPMPGGVEVVACSSEQELLMRWRDFFVDADPDLVMGYNIINFDLPYLLNRAETLELKSFPFLGRLLRRKTRMRDTEFNSKAQGRRKSKDINLNGRLQFDLLVLIQQNYKLRSYTLNAVSGHFLQMQKADVPHQEIPILQDGNSTTRLRLAIYCKRDAELPIFLAEKLLFVVNNFEMARVCGVPISFLTTRGQSVKVKSQLLRKARQRGFVIPVRDKNPDEKFEKYEGAIVLEPLRGFYQDPVATLDFASLYPSIMQAHNLCYTTWLPNADVCPSAAGSVPLHHATPNGDRFVDPSVRKGLLPEILEELLAARKRAKQEMAKATDASLISVLNGRQLALKISANSVYGFAGAQVGELACLPISAGVTAYGRSMIERTRDEAEQLFGPPVRVIGGDTDSIFLLFPGLTVEESMARGRTAAAHITKCFPSPIKLEFEKVYCPYLLLAKKRYAGLYWTKPEKWDKLDAKGIESVRRDNCQLVGKVITEVLESLLMRRDVARAKECVKDAVCSLLQNRCDLSLLVITKGLSKATPQEYKNKQPHVELAIKMRARDPNSAPGVGDRVPYVIVCSHKKAKLFEKAEDPIFVLKNNLQLDTDYYLSTQLQPPVERILEPVIGESAVSNLFHGDHTLRVQRPKGLGATAPLCNFVKVVSTCLACRHNSTNMAVCQECLEEDEDVLLRTHLSVVEEFREAEKESHDCWSQCQRCQNRLMTDLLPCANRECPIFYKRDMAKQRREELQRKLDRFANVEK